MNEIEKTESESGPSLKPNFQTPGSVEEGFQGRCPPETLPIKPMGQIPSSSSLIPGCKHLF